MHWHGTVLQGNDLLTHNTSKKTHNWKNILVTIASLGDWTSLQVGNQEWCLPKGEHHDIQTNPFRWCWKYIVSFSLSSDVYTWRNSTQTKSVLFRKEYSIPLSSVQFWCFWNHGIRFFQWAGAKGAHCTGSRANRQQLWSLLITEKHDVSHVIAYAVSLATFLSVYCLILLVCRAFHRSSADIIARGRPLLSRWAPVSVWQWSTTNWRFQK